MKTKYFYGKTFEKIDELEQSIKDYVCYYNEERIQLKLKGLIPYNIEISPLNNRLTFGGRPIFHRFKC